jgi:signal transduction histidine kinase
LFVANHENSGVGPAVVGSLTEIVYARAVGRGQSAGADAAWGVDIATQVMERNDVVLQKPQRRRGNVSADGNANQQSPAGYLAQEAVQGRAAAKSTRLGEAYLLGLPLRTSTGLYGAMVFVRFGGPAYSDEHILHARYIAAEFAGLFERKKLNEDIRALEEARRLLALQDDFIATISHELRTPLGFIKGYSTTLLRQDTEWDETTRREFLTIIEEEADHLTALIENVLESARLQSNTLPIKFQPTRLDTLIVETASRAQARFKDMQVNFDFSVRPVVQVDSVRIAQVLSNLFSNAAKYAPGASISIFLSEIPGYYRIRFADNGPGISPEHLPHLFNRFFRVPGQGGSGSGLGLFICSKLIIAHGGKISAESEFGMGTAFLLDLPVVSATRSIC